MYLTKSTHISTCLGKVENKVEEHIILRLIILIFKKHWRQTHYIRIFPILHLEHVTQSTRPMLLKKLDIQSIKIIKRHYLNAKFVNKPMFYALSKWISFLVLKKD